jgi:hypothetical protein
VVIVHGQSKLLEIVAALHTTGGFACRLYGWEQQSNKNANDRNYDQQFNERKATLPELIRFHVYFP